MKTCDILLMIAKGVINILKEELVERNAAHEQQKMSKNIKKGSIDVEFRVKE